MQSKVCSGCGIELDISMFYKDKRNNDWYQSQCKNCLKKCCSINIEL